MENGILLFFPANDLVDANSLVNKCFIKLKINCLILLLTNKNNYFFENIIILLLFICNVSIKM